MVVTGGPDGAIPQSPAVRRRNGFAEACSVRCGAGASPATPTACEPLSGGSAASSATPPTNPPTSSTSTASATACPTPTRRRWIPGGPDRTGLHRLYRPLCPVVTGPYDHDSRMRSTLPNGPGGGDVTITMLGGEPAVLIWRSADLGATLDTTGDLGLPVACSLVHRGRVRLPGGRRRGRRGAGRRRGPGDGSGGGGNGF